MPDETEGLKKTLTTKRQKTTAIPARDFLSTGFTPLNLAFTGHPDRGVAKGLCFLFIGDSSTGKTWLGMNILGEASISPAFDNYNLVYDPAENGKLMNVRKYWPKLADRILTPSLDPNRLTCSQTVEEFYDTASAIVKQGPCIYVLDSMDALTTKEEKKQVQKESNARAKNTEAKGTYGTSKPKENSARLRVLTNDIKDNGSILVIISQTRQNIGFTARYNPRTRSGGDSLTFYSRIELWMSRKERIRQEIGTNKVVIGQITKVKVTKNHICGWEGEVDVPIYRNVGIDDVGGCIDYLTDWGHWTVTKNVIDAKEFGVKLKREKLAQHIEFGDMEDDLKGIVTQVWKEIDERCTVRRKNRYE
jgi:hypothetical protein